MRDAKRPRLATSHQQQQYSARKAVKNFRYCLQQNSFVVLARTALKLNTKRHISLIRWKYSNGVSLEKRRRRIMPEISLFALIGEASLYTVFPGLITYGIMYFVKRHIAHVRAQRRYGELIDNVAKATGLKHGMAIVSEVETRIELDGDPAALLKARQDMIDAGITFEGKPLIETTGFGPAHTVMFRVLKGKRNVCELYHSTMIQQDPGKKYKTGRFTMSRIIMSLDATKHTIFTAKYQKKLQILTVYPPTKTRKDWYISVQKYDEEGNKTDLEKAHLNKGSTFVYGYDIEVEK